jgi:adenylate cyclase
MPTIKRRTVLFADLRGSTALYESFGDTRASAMVTEAIRPLLSCIPGHQGQLVKTLGDGLMAVFPASMHAVQAALQMQDELELLKGQAPWTSDGPALHLQVAITTGEVVEMNGDCFGDAVNVAARLIEHAGDGEGLVSRASFDDLPPELRQRCRPLDKVRLRGRQEPVEVFQLARVHLQSDTQITQLEPISSGLAFRSIELSHQGRIQQFSRDDLPLLLGRGQACNVRIEDARVSRLHARMDLQGDALQVADLSINGTFVRFADETEVLSLRRGSCTLHGQGEIALGSSPYDPQAPLIRFALMMND